MTSKTASAERKSRVSVIIAEIVQSACHFGGRIERGLVVAIESVRRAWFRLDPRLYSIGRRIRCITEGSAPTGSGKFAVFVVYARGALPAFTVNFIAALNRNSYNVIVVSNADLDAVTTADLLRNCCLLIERNNFGRDFGGYKDGISVVFERFQNIKRLIIANDSLFYLAQGLDRLVADLDGTEDFIGVSEVFDHHYHAASFLLSFGPAVLGDPVFRKFWTDYSPIPTRMWAILEGEGELSRRLMNAGHRPLILYQAKSLAQKFQYLGVAECANVVALFPMSIRRDLLSSLMRSAKEAETNAFAEAAFEEIMKRNQMHAGGFAFVKLLGMPFFKRDIVYRELFLLEDVNSILLDLREPMRAQIVADLARRLPPGKYNYLRRLLYNHGYA